MPAVAKKIVKVKKEKDVTKKPKKQSIKKLQKTAEINAAKKLTKLKAKKAVSHKLNTPFVQKQKSRHQFDPKKLKRGVLLIKNLPHGFYERQLKKYFGQYGEVTRLRLARSEETGRSKHYAYIEFKYPEVANIAAESMNNYIMFRQCLKTAYIPPEKQDHDYFKQTVKVKRNKRGDTKLITPKKLRAQEHVRKINAPVSAEQIADRAERSQYKLKYLEKKLAKAGIKLNLSEQLYSGGSDEEKVENKTDKKSKKEAKIAAKAVAKKSKAESKNKLKKDKKSDENGNTTLENLLENTIQTSDEDASDDDDYEPTPDELAQADKFIAQFLSVESSDDENDTTLNKFLNNTIDSEESDEDDDYEPTEEEIVEATAVQKAQKTAKKLSKIDSNDLGSKKKSTKVNETKQKKRKTEVPVKTEVPAKKKNKKTTAVQPVVALAKAKKSPVVEKVEKKKKTEKPAPKVLKEKTKESTVKAKVVPRSKVEAVQLVKSKANKKKAEPIQSAKKVEKKPTKKSIETKVKPNKSPKKVKAKKNSK